MFIHLFPFLHRDEKVTPPVAVQGAEQSLLFDHLRASRPSPSASIPPPPIARSRSHWWRRSRITIRSYQRSSFSQRCLLPSMCSSIPGKGRRGRLRRCGPRLCRWPPSRSLQRFLYPGVAQLNTVLLPQLFVEVPDVQVVVRFPCIARAPSLRFQRNTLRTRLPPPPVGQAGIAIPFQPASPPAHGPIRHPDDFCCRPPGDLLRHCFNNTSCTFIIRSISAAEYCWVRPLPASPAPTKADQITCELDRTTHILRPLWQHPSSTHAREVLFCHTMLHTG